MFIGREHELKALEKLYASNKFEFAVIYGRRRVGKTALILCGSSISYMEDHVLAYKAPLYGRRTAQMKLLPASLFILLKIICSVFGIVLYQRIIP